MNTGLLILFCLLQAADVYTTLTVLKQGGRELNPVLAKLFTRFDPLAVMVGIKLVGVWALFASTRWPSWSASSWSACGRCGGSICGCSRSRRVSCMRML